MEQQHSLVARGALLLCNGALLLCNCYFQRMRATNAAS
jgi:hypothetical protein